MKYFVLAVALLLPEFSSAAQHFDVPVMTQVPIISSRVPQGAERVAMDQLQLHASCSAPLSVTAFTVTHAGRGDSNDIARIYVLDGQTRLSRAVQIDHSTQQAIVRFKPFTVAPCHDATLVIAADFLSTAAATGEHQLRILQRSDVQTDTLGVQLQTANTSNAASVTPSTPTDIHLASLPLHTPVTYGPGRVLYRFRIQITGVTQVFRAITLTNAGSAEGSDLRNLLLEGNDGKAVTSVVPTLDGKRVRLLLTQQIQLRSGNDLTFQLVGDVRASRRRTIQFSVEVPSDVEVGRAR